MLNRSYQIRKPWKCQEGLSGTLPGSSRLQGGETLALGVLPARSKSNKTGRERRQEELPQAWKENPAEPRAG